MVSNTMYTRPLMGPGAHHRQPGLRQLREQVVPCACRRPLNPFVHGVVAVYGIDLVLAVLHHLTKPGALIVGVRRAAHFGRDRLRFAEVSEYGSAAPTWAFHGSSLNQPCRETAVLGDMTCVIIMCFARCDTCPSSHRSAKTAKITNDPADHGKDHPCGEFELFLAGTAGVAGPPPPWSAQFEQRRARQVHLPPTGMA